MARAGVTYFDIVEAAKAVKALGEEPTVDRVRSHLGTGSKSTIAPLLKRWRSEIANDTDVSGLPRDLVEALKGLHQRIQGQADQRVEEVQQEFRAQEESIAAQLSEVQEKNSKQAASVRELERKLAIAETEKRQLKRALDDTQKAVEKSEFQREEALGRIQEQKESIEEMRLENRDIREHFEHFQQRTASDRQHERDQFRSASEQLKGQVATLTEQLALTERKLSEQELLNKHGQALVAEVNREKHDLCEQVGASQAEVEVLRRQAEDQGKLDMARATEITSLQNQLAQLQSDYSALAKEAQLQYQSMEKLEIDLTLSKDRIEQLADENRILLQEKAMIQGQFTQLENSLKIQK
ncbi:hypothetical protein Misp06_02701 [Microbulbifer sp. NBRC 101763]|uniref:DNA-binding protein n=1 Tax=Microbulbifer sp. NBRC 101763 TaxID=1113820 RepID=UPI0030A13F9A